MEQNSVSKMDLDWSDFSPSFESSTETSGKICTVYTMQKNVWLMQNRPQTLAEKITTCSPNTTPGTHKVYVPMFFLHHMSYMMGDFTLTILCSMYLRLACPVRSPISILQCFLSSLFIYWMYLPVGPSRQVQLVLYFSTGFPFYLFSSFSPNSLSWIYICSGIVAGSVFHQYPSGTLLAASYSLLTIHPISAGSFHLEILLSHVAHSQCLNLVLQSYCDPLLTTFPPRHVQRHVTL